MKSKILNDKILKYLILFIPISLIAGSLILNLNLVIISLFFLIGTLLSTYYRNYLKIDWFIIGLVFLLLQIISSLINFSGIDSVIRSLGFLKFLLLALSIKLVFENDHKNFFLFLKILSAVIIFIIIDSLIQYFFGQNIFGVKYDHPRLSSVFVDTFVVGSFLSKTGFLVTPLVYFYFDKLRNKNIYVFLWFLLLFITILLSGDRMPFLVFVMGITLYYFMKSLKSFKHLLSLILIYSTFLIVFITSPTVSERFKELTHEQYGLSKTLDIRNSQYGAHFLTAYEIFKKYPILGVGAKNFRAESCKSEYENIQSAQANRRCSTHPHNIVFEILSEHGIAGMICFILIIFYTLKNLKINDDIKIFYLISLIIYIWPIGTSGSIFTSWNGTFLWINIGILSFIKERLILQNENWILK